MHHMVGPKVHLAGGDDGPAKSNISMQQWGAMGAVSAIWVL